MDDPEPTMSDPTDRSPSKPARPRGGPLGWVFVYTRGLIVDQHLRRLTMFYVVIGALVTAFVAGLFVSDYIDPRANFSWFALDTLGCGLLTILAILLTIYDLLLVRLQARLARHQLRRRMLDEDDANHNPEP